MVVRHVGSGNQTQVFCRSTESSLLPSHPSSPSSLPGPVFQTRVHYAFKAVLKFLVRACCLFLHCGRILLHIIAVRCSKHFWDCSWSDEQQNNFSYSSKWNKGRWSSPCLEKSVDCHGVWESMQCTEGHMSWHYWFPPRWFNSIPFMWSLPASLPSQKVKAHKMWFSRHIIVTSVFLPSKE